MADVGTKPNPDTGDFYTVTDFFVGMLVRVLVIAACVFHARSLCDWSRVCAPLLLPLCRAVLTPPLLCICVLLARSSYPCQGKEAWG